MINGMTEDRLTVLNDDAERYQEERGEARACGDYDFPTFIEWRQNDAYPDAERIRADYRLSAPVRSDLEASFKVKLQWKS